MTIQTEEYVVAQDKPLGKFAFYPLAEFDRLWLSTVDWEEMSPGQIKKFLDKNMRRLLPDLLRFFLANQTNPTLWGPVGSRKTRTLQAFAQEKSANGVPFQFITIQPSTQDPTIIHGMYYIAEDPDTGKTTMLQSVPDVAQQVEDYYVQTGGYSIILCDEMTTCLPSQQNALLAFPTHGVFGPITIKDKATFCMAANPRGTVSTVNDLGEAMLNRGAHLAWYGDQEVFVEEWSTGFGGSTTPPEDLTQWYVTSLMNESREEVFRGNWKIDGLVPYNMFEHSERIVTEHGVVLEFVNHTLQGKVPDAVRHYVIVEVTRAMLGPTWANRMAIVCSKEAARLTPDMMIEHIVTECGVTFNMDYDDFEKVASKIPTYDGKKLSQSRTVSVGSELTETFVSQQNNNAYLAVWALASSFGPDSEEGAMLTAHLVHASLEAMQRVKLGEFNKSHLVPSFTPEDIKTRVRALIRREQTLSS